MTTKNIVDPNGVVASAKAGMQMYEHAARGSGRTWRMLAAAPPKSLIIATDEQHASYMRSMLRKLDRTDLKVAAMKPSEDAIHRLADYRKAEGAVMLDHNWTYRFFDAFIDRVHRELDTVTRMRSHQWRLDGETGEWIPTSVQELQPIAGYLRGLYE